MPAGLNDAARLVPLKNTILACRYLSSAWLTYSELGALLGVSGRTARRYANAARSVGVTIFTRARDNQMPPFAKNEHRLCRESWVHMLDLPRD